MILSKSFMTAWASLGTLEISKRVEIFSLINKNIQKIYYRLNEFIEFLQKYCYILLNVKNEFVYRNVYSSLACFNAVNYTFL